MKNFCYPETLSFYKKRQFDWIMPHNFKPLSFVCSANLRACFLGDGKCGIREINANSGLKDMDQHTLSNVDASSGGC